MSKHLKPDELRRFAARLRQPFLTHGYTPDGVIALLGYGAHAAIARGEPDPARRTCRRSGQAPVGTLISLFMLADHCSSAEIRAALGREIVDIGLAAGALVEHHHGAMVSATVDIRPTDLGSGVRWMVSDIDGSTRRARIGPDHVPGVGHASVSLLRATPTEPVRSVLDLGTGCGVHAIRAGDYATHIVATDISARSAVLAAATAAMNDVDIDIRIGSWFDPVAGEKFDRIVANPPFVVGPPTMMHSYRDSGLDLDGASALMVRAAPDHLRPGGIATLLASWVHVRGQDWRERLASWIPDHGVDAWILQRDIADPALYVGTWIRDGGLDPRDAAAAATSTAWLDHLERADVAGIGFGVIYLRRTEVPSRVIAEDLAHPYSDPLGPEALAHFRRLDWAAAHTVADSRCALDPHAILEVVHAPGEAGWDQQSVRIRRVDGPQWAHEIDDAGATLLSALRHDGPTVGEMAGVLAAAHGLDREDLTQAASDLVGALIAHGIVVPSTPKNSRQLNS